MQYGYIYPYFVIATEGELVTITCISFTTPTWSKFGNTKIQHPIIGSHLILDLKLEDAGYYYCTGTFENETEFNYRVSVRVGGNAG